MQIQLTLSQMQELNNIISMLRSFDEEAKKLGFTMLCQTEIYKKYLSGSLYITESGKQIPINWFHKKVLENQEDKYPYWANSYIRILEDLLKGKEVFMNKFSFTDPITTANFNEFKDKIDLMVRNGHSPEAIIEPIPFP